MKKPHRKNNARIADKSGARTGNVPVRRCIVTRETRPQNELLRFALSPDGVVTPDVSGKLPGRGVWLTPDQDVLAQAISKKSFASGFKSAAKAPDGLIEAVEQGLLSRCLNLLGLAKKAGHVVLGFDQVRTEIKTTKPAIIIEASDGAKDGRQKILSLVTAKYESAEIIGGLASSELGMAFGRDHVVHGCVREASVKHILLESYKMLTGFRGAPEKGWLPEL